jgi:hypothetical protein
MKSGGNENHKELFSPRNHPHLDGFFGKRKGENTTSCVFPERFLKSGICGETLGEGFPGEITENRFRRI